MLLEYKAPSGSFEQQEPHRMAADTTTCHIVRPVETYSLIAYVKVTLLSFSDFSTLLRLNEVYLWRCLFLVWKQPPEQRLSLTIIRDPDFEAYPFRD